MRRLFSVDSPVMTALSSFADLILVNLLMLLTALPVATAGAAIAAGFCLTRRIGEGTLAHPVRSFFQAFRENFRQVTLLWIPCVCLLLGLVWDIWLLQPLLSEQSYRSALVLLAALIVLVLGMWIYLLLLVTGFENSLAAHVKNAMLLFFQNLPLSVLLAGLNGLPFLLALVSPRIFLQTAVAWLGFGFALILLLDNLMLKKLRKKLEKS